MGYYDIATLARDPDFALRTIACAATEHIPGDPGAWQARHAWQMAAMPGFGDAYASALVNNNPAPGKDPAVITDAQILSAVQLILSHQTTDI